MAASVDNRHFHLETAFNGVVRSLKSGPTPARNFNLSSQNFAHSRPKPARPLPATADDLSSDEEDETEDYYKPLIQKGNAELEPLAVDSRDLATADNWIRRNPAMIRLTGKHPFNGEAPLTRLMNHGFITPVPLHYVRNHGQVPKASWSSWTVEISGLVKNPTWFTMDQLVHDFPSREFPVTLVCAGNRRKEQNMVQQTVGFNWGPGAVSTSVWRGVPLHLVLKRCGIYSHRMGALNVCFEGAENLPGGGGSKYGTSIRKEVAMDPSRDIILAYMQNGEVLAPDHGFPVRVIIPGFIGGRMVKWLKRIVVTTKESDNYYHYKDNRVLPSHVDSELTNAEAWWYKPEYIINELNINSVITTPSHEEVLPINSWTTQRPYTLKGYAYSGGGKKVIKVEVTLNSGDTWLICNLDHQEKPNRYGKYWCWCFWSLEVEVLDLLGAKEIAVRAWDATHNTQPEKLNWNVMGMMNNCWFRIKTNVCKQHKGEIGIIFEHPTVPGNHSTGWMAKEKHQKTSSVNNRSLKKSVSTPFMNTTFSMTEVKKHNIADSCWIIIHSHVYDCTRILKDHPGGVDSILINGGTDCTDEFEAIHSDRAKKMLEEYRIGELVRSTESGASSPNDSVHGRANLAPITEIAPIKRNVALISKEKIQCKLVKKQSLSHNVRLFRFALPSEDQVLGLPVGKHVLLCATVDGKLCMRAYTPTSGIEAFGYFDLVVKIYLKGVNPKFPNGGHMSQHLDSLELGSTVDVKGPLGHIEYTGRGTFSVNGKNKSARKLAMIAGGTGITPIYQVIQAILKDSEDETEMFVVYANCTEDDILLREELDAWSKEHARKLKVWYVVGKAEREGWGYSVGYITEDILRAHVPIGSDDVLALACGPAAMIQFAVQPNLEKMGYDVKDSLLVF